ncbi:hypothetical protein SAMN02949497_1107 [Methylomagnum ishizawai]|uniref:Uncharacterized protein n=1 Tax=Methylomagnum ishizawai TaxID=1760988 RepID=A0A1Y6D1G4_9GAMM|nr:hypothetical protein [Methylomagnum ishizawai]SMF93815.1 hypothetical protein SAMN02949497_1107 [Methylomagnum ishizawai]
MNIQKLVSFNFHFAVWLSILGGIAVINHPDFIVPDDDGMYGPLLNNFLVVIGYLVFSQLGLWYFRYLKGSRIEALIMAYTFFATAVGAKFYGMVNNLPVSDAFVMAMAYLAVSHGFYYAAGLMEAETRAAQAKHPGPDV